MATTRSPRAGNQRKPAPAARSDGSREVTGLLKLLLEEYSAALAKAKEVADE
jgi:hypothetical protein